MPEPAARTAQGGDLEEVSRLLAGLPEAQQEVVRLRFVEDLELHEIAAALDIPLGTVKSRLHAALQALRERWKRR
ncbi:MAG: sigma-70 family RNA polymerase sigma factor [Planctomycetes bacterium]|nr:sigma-70 family RNA polymerase sigma factor [Planctomycetota bacterium]